jgi:hypothetical protein
MQRLLTIAFTQTVLTDALYYPFTLSGEATEEPLSVSALSPFEMPLLMTGIFEGYSAV